MCSFPFSVSRSVMSNSLQPHGLWPTRLLCPWNSSGKNTGVGCHFLLHGIFPTQGLNPSLQPCRWTLHQLSHKGSPRILDWVAYPFFSGSSQPRNQTGVSCDADKFFTSRAAREARSHFFLTSPDQLFKTTRTASSWAEFIRSGCCVLQAIVLRTQDSQA